jgi:hypothetical protein
MIRTDLDIKIWNQKRKDAFAVPRPDLLVTIAGKTFVRNLGKRCPHCGDVFYGYQVEGNEREPFRYDPEPRGGEGIRETCGDPTCWDREDRYQWTRRKAACPKAMVA